MEKIEVTWGTTLRVWWSYVWRSALFSMLLGFVLGLIGGIIVGIVGGTHQTASNVGAILGYLGSIPVSIWVLKKILSKKYKEFSVALVKEDNTSEAK
jgi:ABC-type nitrate/sulfonate/bicarbonate transport system permease component